MTLTESIGQGWRDITNAKRLRGALLNACRRLRQLGHAELAATWQARLRRQPARMTKESINCVLLAAHLELERHGISD